MSCLRAEVRALRPLANLGSEGRFLTRPDCYNTYTLHIHRDSPIRGELHLFSRLYNAMCSHVLPLG